MLLETHCTDSITRPLLGYDFFLFITFFWATLYMSLTCGRATGIEVKGWAVSGLSIYKERSERIDI